MSRLGHLGGDLYRGDVSYDFVGRRKRWYTISGLILLVAVLSLAIRGLTLGIEFSGGAVITVPTKTGTVAEATQVALDHGSKEPIVTEVNTPSQRSLRIETESLPNNADQALTDALILKFDANPNDVTTQVVGPSWGGEITKKALTGLVVFLVLILLFLTLYFEYRMAVAALVALAHDLIITVGIYSLVGFTVTPATVIGVLTILGYSLYDIVVVFDKVKENTRGLTAGSRMTYSTAANLALNQTLVRSINTSVIALLPVAAILFVGPLLGAETLKDLSLALFIGIAAGTYSSIFIATPVLCQLKEREPAMQSLAKRVAAREAAGKSATSAGPAPAAALEVDGVEAGSVAVATATRGPAQRPPSKRPAGPGSKRSATKKKRR